MLDSIKKLFLAWRGFIYLESRSIIPCNHRGASISEAEIADYVVNTYREYGYDVRHVDDFAPILFPLQEFNIVYLMQVFEYLRDLHGFIRELARVVKPGRMLHFAVSNAASARWNVFGQNWVSEWFAPFHQFHYTCGTLAKLAGPYGFELINAWSWTPESWFQLNPKAALYPKEHQLGWYRLG